MFSYVNTVTYVYVASNFILPDNTWQMLKTLNGWNFLNIISLRRFLHRRQDTQVLNSKLTFCVPHLQDVARIGYDEIYLDSIRSVAVPILEILAEHTNHITYVNFECAYIPLVSLLGEFCRTRQCSLLHMTDCQ